MKKAITCFLMIAVFHRSCFCSPMVKPTNLKMETQVLEVTPTNRPMLSKLLVLPFMLWVLVMMSVKKS